MRVFLFLFCLVCSALVLSATASSLILVSVRLLATGHIFTFHLLEARQICSVVICCVDEIALMNAYARY